MGVDLKISAMTLATTLGGTEKIPAVQLGGNVYTTPTQLKAFMMANTANIFGYVTAYADLPLGITVNDPEIGDLVGVNTTTGIWLIGTQRRMGFYKRVALTGVASTDYGTSPFAGMPIPVEITTSTDTDMTGLLKGDSGKMAVAVESDITALVDDVYLHKDSLGTANQVLHGNPSGDLTMSAVVEDDISLSAVSTNNVQVGKHGFAPALPGSTSLFLRGDGAYATPASVTVPNAYVEESFAYTANAAHNIVHNFGARPVVQCVTSTGDMIIPLTINHADLNTVAITFDDSATYDVVLTMGSPPFTNLTVVSDDYTVLANDYTIKQTVAGKTITLITAVGRLGKLFRIKNSSTGDINVIFTGGQNADGYTNVTIPSQNSYDFQSDGSNYLLI